LGGNHDAEHELTSSRRPRCESALKNAHEAATAFYPPSVCSVEAAFPHASGVRLARLAFGATQHYVLALFASRRIEPWLVPMQP
jgi:hypothetical protein